jgi:branched-chain amino acid transport system substrate-binding protein
MRRTRTWLAAAIVALPCIAPAAMTPVAMAADTVKIGFVGTFSGPAAAIGNDMRDGFNLGLEHLGRQMAGKPVEVLFEDDTQKPEVGKQKTDKLIESDRVNFLTGYGFSNVLLASLLPAVNSQTFIISANAGPSQIAGEQCSPYFFSVSWQGDQAAQATGEYLNQKGIKTLFLIDPNYAAGKDVAAGVKANFKGQVVGEEYTAWPGQLDFSAELTKARGEARRDLRLLSGRRRRAVSHAIRAVRPEGPDPALHGLHDRRAVAAEDRRARARHCDRRPLGDRPAECHQREIRLGLPRRL